MTQKAYFSLMAHTKQLLLVTICHTTARIGVSFRTHGRTDGRTADGGRTDRRESRNSYLDFSPSHGLPDSKQLSGMVKFSKNYGKKIFWVVIVKNVLQCLEKVKLKM